MDTSGKGFNITGIYLFGKDENGKRQPTEIEYLTREELDASMKGRSEEELINWISALCENIVKVEDFMKSEGYVTKREEE